MTTLKIGDVVWLKSGGPSMTVVRLRQSMVTVVWFGNVNESIDKPQTAKFYADALNVRPSEPTPIKAAA